MLNRAQILAAVEPPAGVVNIAEWGGDVGIRRLTALEVRELRTEADGEDSISSLSRFAARVLCDADGKRLWTDGESAELETRGWDLLLRISKAATRLNGMSGESREELRKNSEPAATSAAT